MTIPLMLGVVRAATSQTSSAAPAFKNLKFEVVSIRQNKSGGRIPLGDLGKATSDGYEMRNMYMIWPILTAYAPTAGVTPFSGHVLGLRPKWFESDRWNIDARVDSADLRDWQNPAKQPAMLRAMLLDMLADRLKLKIHLITKEEPIYVLSVRKKGPRFKQSVPGESHPASFPAPGGGSMSMQIKDGLVNHHYFDMTIDQLISWEFKSADRPIENRTGLSGKYDFTVTQPLPPGAGTPEVKPVEMSSGEKANQLGLKLEPAEGKVEFLVIDHIERPSPN